MTGTAGTRDPIRRRAGRTRRLVTGCAILTATAAVLATGAAAADPATGAVAVRPASAAAGHPAGPTAARISYCGRTRVTVIVDFTHFRHGKIRAGCARNPRTGLVALRDARFSYTFVPRQPGFICTIDHLPGKCNGAPVTAYWSYWHARPHGKWQYSSLGAGSYHPRRGWIEGWAFGNGKPPHISPP